jgi:polyisoprenoid-binding protein YceI
MSTIQEAITAIPAGTYQVDPAHSSAEFAATHMGISTVHGHFLKFEATLEGGDQPHITGTIETGSATTHDEQRDGHLKTPDFFDTERYPTATFNGSLVAPDRLEGELTLKGVTKPIEMAATITGPASDPWGNDRVGIDLEGTVNRHDFGVDFNMDLPSGGKLLEDTVTLVASLSFVKQA